MTNLERLMRDKEWLIELLAGNEGFLSKTVEPNWCGKVCPHKDQCKNTPEFHPCFTTNSELFEWWFEQEATI